MADNHTCLELFALPPDLASPLPGEGDASLPGDAPPRPGCARDKTVEALTIKASNGAFPDGALAHKARISFVEEAVVILALLVIMGGPIAWFVVVLPATLLLGSWTQLALFAATTVFLSAHPLPKLDYVKLRKSWFVFALYKYISFRMVTKGNVRERCQTIGPWMGAGVPHGVLPFANILSMLGVNSFSFCGNFVGAPASVVFQTPFLRYLTLLGPTCDVGAKGMVRELDKGHCVGLVPDGIAGIFRCNEEDETIYLKNRKGLAKLALKSGYAIVPAYMLGNTAAFSAWFDPFGIMETVSRKLQASLFVYWGRFYLPIPHRTPITMLVGDPVEVPAGIKGGKVENPSQEQIDEMHGRILAGIKDTFDAHKGACGWGHKVMKFV